MYGDRSCVYPQVGLYATIRPDYEILELQQDTHNGLDIDRIDARGDAQTLMGMTADDKDPP